MVLTIVISTVAMAEMMVSMMPPMVETMAPYEESMIECQRIENF